MAIPGDSSLIYFCAVSNFALMDWGEFGGATVLMVGVGGSYITHFERKTVIETLPVQS